MLDISEMRLQVFRCLRMTDVRSLKLVCKTWYPEADQVIWEGIETLPPLLRLLPEDAWEEGTGSQYSGRGKVGRTWPENFNITRPLRPEDWSEVIRHALHLKFYRMDKMLSTCTDAALEAIIACPPPQFPLLTGVRSLRLFPSPKQLALYGKLLHLLIPHQYITSLICVAVEQFMPDADDFISRFQRLNSLSLHVDQGRYAHEDPYPLTTWNYAAFDPSYDEGKRYDIRFVKALEHCSELQHLDITLHVEATIYMLRTLSENSTLQSLTLHYGRKDMHQFENDLSAAYTFPPFPSLRCLEIEGLPLGGAARILPSQEPTPLEEIRLIDYMCNAPSEDYGRFGPLKGVLLATLDLICSQLEPYHSLCVLHIEVPSYGNFTFTLGDIRPLSAFPHMREITIITQHKTALVDADCEQMAKWWPSLEVFRLGCECPTGDPECTLHGLLALASRCPRLARLELPLDARSIPDFLPGPGRAPSPYASLTHLNVGDAPIADAKHVARFMKSTFPKLRLVGYSSYRLHDDVGQRVRKWHRVVDELTGLKPEA
ncbi:hypothetical protein BD626DRAFT_577205 [Schizophyllum amplum]|uniref:F-box domain-containing protein n=1 Tax=Schizophyllum amplum TaxID=97359 RepID=A0A550BSR2_9AGAR|nr:hypothetical protein BD626DRAFT_577205 [Auriculariopsis ampla]